MRQRARRAPGPISGKVHLYVEQNRGTSDLDTVTEPPTLLPFVQDDSGARYALSRGSTYNYLRNSGFWFHQKIGSGGSVTSGVGNRAIGLDGWGITASAVINCGRVTNDRPYYRNPHYTGTFLYDGISTRRLMVSQVVESSDAMALRGKIVRLQARIWLTPTEYNRDSGQLLRRPTTRETRVRVRLGLAKLSGGTPDVIPTSGFVTNFSNDGAPPIFASGITLIPPLTYGIDGQGVTADQWSVTGFGTGHPRVPFPVTETITSGIGHWKNQRGMRRGGLWLVPNDVQNLIFLIWTEQFIPNSLDWTTAGMYITAPSLTVGEAIPEWTSQSMADELRRCQRFMCTSFNPTIDSNLVPGQNRGVAGAVKGIANAGGAAAGQVLPIVFPTQMRIPPTITTYNPSAANAFVRNLRRAADAAATATANIDTRGADVTFTGIGGGGAWTAGDAVAVHYSADAEI